MYLRVSGQFHIIVGMLHLFGFNLAETHHLYYLSSSFTRLLAADQHLLERLHDEDLFLPDPIFGCKGEGRWRRWWFRRWSCSFSTWLLHAVQWFWLRGTFLVAANDMLFWAILAGLVVVNSLIELKYGRQRAITAGDISWSGALRLALQTLATFTVICLLWSLWTSESLTAWLSLWQFALVPPTLQGWLLIAATVAADRRWGSDRGPQPQRLLLEPTVATARSRQPLCPHVPAGCRQHFRDQPSTWSPRQMDRLGQRGGFERD